RYHAAGVPITFHYKVTNLGNVTLGPPTVTDQLPGLSPVSCPTRPLAPGASLTCSATYTTTRADVQHGHIDNAGIGAAPAPNGATVTNRQPLTVSGPTPYVPGTGSTGGTGQGALSQRLLLALRAFVILVAGATTVTAFRLHRRSEA